MHDHRESSEATHRSPLGKGTSPAADPVKSEILALQMRAGNAAVQRYFGDKGFENPPTVNLGAERKSVAGWTTTAGASLSQKDVANLSAAVVRHVGQSRQTEAETIVTVTIAVDVSGNPTMSDGRPRYVPKGRSVTRRPKERCDCAEPKTLARVRKRLREIQASSGPNPRPVVYLFTEHGPCKYCRSAFDEFRAGYPWVDLRVEWNRWFYADFREADDWAGTSADNGGTASFAHTAELSPRPWPDRRSASRESVADPQTFNPYAALRLLRGEPGEPEPSGHAPDQPVQEASARQLAEELGARRQQQGKRRKREAIDRRAAALVSERKGRTYVDGRGFIAAALAVGAITLLVAVLRAMFYSGGTSD
ncbi:hypothetical protein LX16_4933 [Stackebrandtia albiflava]|uniref:Uncharacterized protein n=1 Tax=Stackebrandtia albiflava TaxID=406432 RepID=A0A562UQ84_9ACTN|nr:hypothetical protein [Stackebrandtia albiflava]TWJ07770.1 hypothetical protein LX16_4933 [Stackebrandtia albiflava]